MLASLFRRAMSSSVAKLPQNVQKVVSAVSSAQDMYGATPKEEAAVTDWLDKLATAKYDSDDSRKALNDELTTRTFLVSDQFTAADVALYASLHPVLSQLKPAQYYATPALTRYFDHVQHLPIIASKSSLPQIPFDLENAPKTERKAPEVKKKDKKPVAEKAKEVAAQVVAPVAAAKEAVVEAVTGKGPSKEKKEKAPKEKKPAPPPPAPKEEDGPPVPSMIDLRVGKIVHVEKHPDADSLYVEQIDIGEPTGPRTVVSGLVNYVPIEQMQGAMLIAVCNLKPAKMRGVLSQAMVLCASGPGKSSVELLRPPEGAKPGDRVYFEGDKFESAQPLSQLNPKKKIFETVQPGFKTLENREAAWVDPESGAVHRIRTKDGVVLAPTLIGASLS